MQIKYTVFLILGILLVVAGIALPYTGIATEGPMLTALISAGVGLLIVTMIYTLRFRDGVQSDERTKKIGAYGITYSRLLTLVLITVLFWVDYLQIMVISLQGVLFILLFGMVLSARIFQWILFKRGDVE